jgi:hypothetical protein
MHGKRLGRDQPRRKNERKQHNQGFQDHTSILTQKRNIFRQKGKYFTVEPPRTAQIFGAPPRSR